jgi:hypothetical protein
MIQYINGVEATDTSGVEATDTNLVVENQIVDTNVEEEQELYTGQVTIKQEKPEENDLGSTLKEQEINEKDENVVKVSCAKCKRSDHKRSSSLLCPKNPKCILKNNSA